MDINRLISTIEKYLIRDLEFSMQEFRQLQLLRDDVKKLEEIMSYSGENQAALLEHYKGHARQLQRYSERIEKRLHVWIKRLQALIREEEQNLAAEDMQYFELWISRINICRSNLIRILASGGELHNLINEQFPDWGKIEAKINEALGDNLHLGIRTLIVLFEQLEQVEEKLGKYAAQEVTPVEYQKRLEQLKQWDFPIEREPRSAHFLINHWNGTIEMAKAAGGNAIFLFQYGLPAVKDMINERTWPGIVEMAKAAGGNVMFLFQYGMPAVKDMINERTWPMIVKDFIEMAKAADINARPLFQYGLPAVKDMINERTWPGIVKDFIEMAKAADISAGLLFEHGLPAVYDIINERTWPGIVEDLVEMAKAAGGNAMYLFRYGMPAVKDMINERTWPIIVKHVLVVGKYVKYVESHLGFRPQSIYVTPKALMNSESASDIGKLLEQQVSLAKQYFNEVGFTNYTKKIIDDNFWNFQYDDGVFNRLKFVKTGSGLVPLGGRFKTKILVRVILQESFKAWKMAQDAGIPVEEIVKSYSAKNGKVRVFCKYAGEQLPVFMREHPEFSEEVKKQRNAIIDSLNKRGIVHGHPHDENFTVSEENGKLVVRAIDFDMAISPPR